MLVDEIRVLDLAASELDYFLTLKKLILQSAENIKSENMEDLLSTLQERQIMISRHSVIIEEWNKIGLALKIEDAYNDPGFWNHLFLGLPNGSSQKSLFSDKLVSFIEKRKTLIKELLEIEDDSQEVLNEYVKRLRCRISQVSKGRNACKGYAAASGASLFSRSIS